MKITDHSLKQLDEAYMKTLSSSELCVLSVKLLNDLKEARDRLNQNSNNSSKPPSSDLLGKGGSRDKESSDSPSNEWDTVNSDNHKDEPSEADTTDEKKPTAIEPSIDQKEISEKKRKAGKQKGSQGYGRTQVLPIMETVLREASVCSACSRPFHDDDRRVAYTGYDTVDLMVESGTTAPGISLQTTRQIFHDSHCPCGHITRDQPYRSGAEPFYDGIEQTEWRLTGPLLASFMVCLSYRNRMSRPRIQEFLWDWFGLYLSVGTIHQTLHESGRSVAPLEEPLLQDILDSDLVHVDETPWKESGQLLWLWVFIAPKTALYYIGYRTKDMVENVLGETFKGLLMSDGYQAYRFFKVRLRCWAHLLRKANGLTESLNKQASTFGRKTQRFMNELIDAVYEARKPGADINLVTAYQANLLTFKTLCEKQRNSKHEKTRELAREFLNDWEAIFRVLTNPHWPLTNNEAERALRHWVIYRRICQGTRTEQGSRVFAILASVIDTCRLRSVSPWPYLAKVIVAGRSGNVVPPLPQAAGV